MSSSYPRGLPPAAKSLQAQLARSTFDAALILIAAGVATINAFWLYPDLRHDDAFVTFQYARNLGSGSGMVFNPGERVLGTTTPLYTLILACVYAVFGDVLPRAAIAIGACALACQAVLLERLLRPLGRAISFGVACLLLAGFSGGYAMLALETHLHAALILGAVLAFDRARDLWCGVLLGLAVLCRADAALLFGLIAAVAWLERRAVPRLILAGTGAVVIPWLITSALYFGSILPHTLAAKRNITPFSRYLSHYAPNFAAGAAPALFGFGESVSIELLTAVACGFGLWQMYRSARGAAWVGAFSALLLLAYAFIGPPAAQHWHMYLPALMYRVSCVVGCACLVQSVARRWIRAEYAGAIAFAYSIALATPMVGRARESAQKTVSSFWLGHRHERYAEVSSWLTAHVEAGCSVLAPEVGTLGYLTRRRMIDPSGLINDTNDFPRVPSLANLAAMVRRSKPDVLLLDSRAQGDFFEQTTEFRIVKSFEGDPWSTILVRDPAVLKAPRAFAAHR